MNYDPILRERLIELANNIQASRDEGWNDVESLAEFERLLPGTDVSNLCSSGMWVETIVDICLGEDETQHILSDQELTALVRRIMFNEPRFPTEAEQHLAVSLFEYNCKHPGKSDLIYYPETHFGAQSNPTPEEVVKKALSGE